MNRLRLDLSEIEDAPLDHSFAVQNGQFIRGTVEISGNGVSRTDRDHSYQGLSGCDVSLVAVIGRGMSSQVNLVRHRSGTLMALKVINMYERNKRNQIIEEIAALYDAKCPALVGFYGAFYQEGSISIALEYMDQGCLASILGRYGPMPEQVLAAVTYQALWGLGYLRYAKRVHRDIKPQNILCNSQGEVKLTDFGISKELENSIGLCQTFVGTFKYMSPERIQSHPYSYASDVWSLGLVLLECLTGQYPYPECRTYIDMVQTILESPPPLPSSAVCSEEFLEFANCCLKKAPTERVRAEVLLRAPWLERQGAVSIDASKEIVRAWLAQQSLTNPAFVTDGVVGSAPPTSARSAATGLGRPWDASSTSDGAGHSEAAGPGGAQAPPAAPAQFRGFTPSPPSQFRGITPSPPPQAPQAPAAAARFLRSTHPRVSLSTSTRMSD